MSKVAHTLMKYTWLYALVAFLSIAPAFAGTSECDLNASRDGLTKFMRQNEIHVLNELKGKAAKEFDKEMRGKSETDDVVFIRREDGLILAFGFHNGCLAASGSVSPEKADKYIHGA